ncbi:hypothetical protein MOQ_002810 [Trypanosoma cruzi marinkellei]|uniref:Uncharacterized protein n=1 Tax=Trypanosoma cruzi marinkellei TaxID=85056 RepID=K2MDN0_TRYCR|nr:hypothetical protein MOQ_002810 [Trypanosoma cruzi marinkellei]
MRSPSSTSPCDSAESIYNLLCAVQAQANADEEEIKTRRLHIANCEREMERTNEEIRFLSEQHEEALEEVRTKRLRGEEQKIRHAGAVEALQCTQQEVAGVVDALFACELPLHPVAAAGTTFEPPQESLPPAMIRNATTSLKQKIRAATEQRRSQVTEPQCLFTAVAHETNLGNDAGHVFAVRFRNDAASEVSSVPTKKTAIVSECTGVEIVSSPSERPRRKVITFNDAQLEVHVEKNHSSPSSSPTAAVSEAPHRRGLEQQEDMRPAAVVSVYGVLNMKRLPRRTFWQKELRPQN